MNHSQTPLLCLFCPSSTQTVDLAKRRRWIRFMIILCSINGALAFTFEIYYYVFRCAVSTKYFDTTVEYVKARTSLHLYYHWRIAKTTCCL